jgi:hypothetical protein
MAEEEESAAPQRAARPPRRRQRRHRLWVPWWAVPIVVVAVLAAGELGARWVGPDLPRKAGSEERLLIKSDQIYDRGSGSTDVVILGSSETAGGLIPADVSARATGLHGIYNAGLPGSELGFMERWARRIVVPNLKPKVAVIGILPMSVQKVDVSGGEGQVQAIAAYESALDQVDPGGLGSITWRLRQHSALIRYRAYLRSPSLALRGLGVALRGGKTVTAEDRAKDATMDWTTETDPDRVKRNTGADGEVFDYRQPSLPIDGDPLGAKIYQRFAQSPADLSELAALVASLRDRGVVPVIAIAPVDRSNLEAGGADLGPLDALARTIEAWGRDHGVPVDDQFTEAWPAAGFHDRNHLALAGAHRWSAEVGTWLGELCAQDRLGDAC